MRFRFYITLWVVSLLAATAPVQPAGANEQVKGSVNRLGESIDGTITFLYYDDLQAAAGFYASVLQLNATMDAEWVKIFEITQGSSVGLVKKGHGQHQPAVDKPVMLSIVTTNVEAWYQRLVHAKVPIVKALPPADAAKEPGSAPVRGFIATDPGGYTIEFFSWQLPAK